MNIDEDFYQRVNAVGLEVDDDGILPVPLGEVMAQTLQEMEERGVITASQMVDVENLPAGGGVASITHHRADLVDPGWEQEIELATKRDAEQQTDPMLGMYDFLDGRSVGMTVIGRGESFRWCWQTLAGDLEEMDPDDVRTYSRLAVAAMRAGL